MYTYRAELLRVVDGDTYDLKVDTGFYMTYAHRFRLYGYDTPELYRGSDFEKKEAQTAKNFVEEWFAANPDFWIRTYKADSFGRWLCDVFTDQDRLSDALVEAHLATEWPTRWREVYDT